MLIRKAQPSSADMRDEMLTNVSVAYVQSTADYVSTRVFPILPVEKQSDRYYVFPREEWMRDEAAKRGDSQETVGGGYKLSDDTYFADVWGYHKDIGEQLRANNRNPLNPERNATQFVTGKLLLRQERDFVEQFMKAGVWGVDWAGVTTTPGSKQFYRFDDYTHSDPIGTIDDAKSEVQTLTGYKPNLAVIDDLTWKKLKNHPDFLERIKYSQKGVVTMELVAELLELEEVMVANGSYLTTAEGATTQTYARIHPKGILICYRPSSPGLEVPSAGYTMAWTGYAGENALGVGINNFYIQSKKTTRIEGEMAYAQKKVCAELGIWLGNAVS